MTDSAICELLRGYEAAAVKAAIKCTDFIAARNPLAVIRWMLSTGSYIMPADRQEPLQPPEVSAPGPEEEKAVRQMIKEARAGLVKKTTQKAQFQPASIR